MLYDRGYILVPYLIFLFFKIETVNISLVLIRIVRTKKFSEKIIRDCQLYRFTVLTTAK